MRLANQANLEKGYVNFFCETLLTQTNMHGLKGTFMLTLSHTQIRSRVDSRANAQTTLCTYVHVYVVMAANAKD